ncbi:MAG: response regulator [Gemmatimonadales bacterium]
MLFIISAILLQLLATLQTWRLARLDAGGGRAWLAIGSGLGLMAVTGIIILFQSQEPFHAPLISLAGALELAVSLLLAGGLSVLSHARASRARGEVAELPAAEAGTRRQPIPGAADSELQYRVLVEASPLSIIAITTEGEVTGWNLAAERLFGWRSEEVLARPLPIVPAELEEEHRRFREEVMKGQVFSGRPTRRRHKSGAVLDLMISTAAIRDGAGRVTGLVAIYEDVTERKRMEERERGLQARLVEAQKLESLGVLAGGIAHDFNNLLTIVQGNTQLAQNEVPPASPAQPLLRHMDTAVARAAELTAQMLAYAGRVPFQVSPLSLAALVEAQTTPLRGLLPSGAMLHVLPASEPAFIRGDPEQLGQVLKNLVTNAGEALPVGGGTIRVTTGVGQIDAARLGQSLFPEALRPGRHAYLEVTDTGSGMDAEVTGRMFEPFFTTRFVGRGLGLAALAGIVRRHGGTVTVDSESGRGTTIRVYLPLTAPAREAGVMQGPSAGTVLIVDDEKEVLRLMGRFLERAGFEAVLAPGGMEALARFREHGGEIDVIILDLTMPGMSGEETLAALRKLDPDLPAILTSGYTRSEFARRGTGMGISGFLQKPYLPSELIQMVREVLTAGRPHPAGSPGPGSR